jgi:hypothetical protein
MGRLERQRDQINEALTRTDDYVEMTRLGGELATVQSQLNEAEENWLTLAEASE